MHHLDDVHFYCMVAVCMSAVIHYINVACWGTKVITVDFLFCCNNWAWKNIARHLQEEEHVLGYILRKAAYKSFPDV